MPDKLILTEFLNTINPYNEKVAEKFYEIEHPFYSLKYCITKDTLHSFNGERCFNCSNFKEKNIDFSTINFIDFKKHFGEAFPLKLIEIIDNWPKKNNFPYLHNNIINTLPEYKKLIEIHASWMRLTKERKLNEIFDISSIQKQYHSKLEEASALKKKLL